MPARGARTTDVAFQTAPILRTSNAMPRLTARPQEAGMPPPRPGVTGATDIEVGRSASLRVASVSTVPKNRGEHASDHPRLNRAGRNLLVEYPCRCRCVVCNVQMGRCELRLFLVRAMLGHGARHRWILPT